MKCKRCNHEICPYCKDWCDTLANNEQEIKDRGIIEIEESENVMVIGKGDDRFPILCCGGECDIE